MAKRTYNTTNNHYDINLEPEVQQQIVDDMRAYLGELADNEKRNSAIGWGVLGACAAGYAGYIFRDKIKTAWNKGTDAVRVAFGRNPKHKDDPLITED